MRVHAQEAQAALRVPEEPWARQNHRQQQVSTPQAEVQEEQSQPRSAQAAAQTEPAELRHWRLLS